MARFDWYNVNESRCYPLTEQPSLTMLLDGNPVVLPNSFLVDIGCVIGPAAYFNEAQDHVYLERISRSGGMLTIVFRSTASELWQEALTFVRPETAEDYCFSESVAGETSSLPAAECGPPFLWEGFLVTGRLGPLLELLPDGEELVAEDTALTVEPCRLQNMADRCVTTVNLANAPRTYVTPPGGCGSSVAEDDTVDFIVNSTCLDGDVRFKEGFNVSISQSDTSNELTFSARVGAGEGRPCNEFPWYDGESSIADSDFYSGGPSCGDIITQINGIAGPSVPIIPKTGIEVTIADGNPSKLLVTFTLDGLAVCIPDDIVSSISLYF